MIGAEELVFSAREKPQLMPNEANKPKKREV
jgi:hypothetical protein